MVRPANDFSPIADLYDDHVTAEFDIPFWVEEAGRGGEVLELMAGTGRVTVPLASAGMRLTSVDVSAAMLKRLTQKLEAQGLVANVVRQDLRELSIGRTFPLAIIPFNSLSEIIDAEDRRAALARIAEHLQPDGRLIVTLRNAIPRWREPDGQVRVLGSYAPRPDGRRLVVLISALPAAQPGVVEAKQFYELYDAAGILIEKRILEIRFALLDRTELEREAADAGLRVEATYGDYDRSEFDASRSPYLISVFRKLRA